MRLLVSAGGTGGHICPALAIVTENQASPTPADQVLWVGTAGEMEEDLVPRAGLPLKTMPGGGLHGVGLRRSLRNGARMAWGWRQARRVVREFDPDVVLLTGGYTNGPVALAAWERRKPMVIFLPDVEPGLAIRVLSRIAACVACSLEASRAHLPGRRVVVTGYPVRPGLVPDTGPSEARTAFDLAPDRPTLLALGGSRGARSINYALMDALPNLLADCQVVHVTGRLDWEAVSQCADELPAELGVGYRPFPYLHEEMGQAFRAADLVVSRAGAATLGEYPAFGVPAVLVPYPHAWRYQQTNAEYLAQAGAAVRLKDGDLSTRLLPTIQQLMADSDRLKRMGAAASALHRPGAARRVADLLVGFAAAGRNETGTPEPHRPAVTEAQGGHTL
jgi:UDP-N-acetylglucosamine--N-acetylmuramyl-(pentapeptide) pyrophosphoryl-undecaprenol N-acetylglucosamine transferase